MKIKRAEDKKSFLNDKTDVWNFQMLILLSHILTFKDKFYHITILLYRFYPFYSIYRVKYQKPLERGFNGWPRRSLSTERLTAVDKSRCKLLHCLIFDERSNIFVLLPTISKFSSISYGSSSSSSHFVPDRRIYDSEYVINSTTDFSNYPI